jgi:hypothetical protein
MRVLVQYHQFSDILVIQVTGEESRERERRGKRWSRLDPLSSAAPASATGERVGNKRSHPKNRGVTLFV